MSDMSQQAQSARESARLSDGKFGTQPHTNPGQLDLTRSASDGIQQQLLDRMDRPTLRLLDERIPVADFTVTSREPLGDVPDDDLQPGDPVSRRYRLRTSTGGPDPVRSMCTVEAIGDPLYDEVSFVPVRTGDGVFEAAMICDQLNGTSSTPTGSTEVRRVPASVFDGAPTAEGVTEALDCDLAALRASWPTASPRERHEALTGFVERMDAAESALVGRGDPLAAIAAVGRIEDSLDGVDDPELWCELTSRRLALTQRATLEASRRTDATAGRLDEPRRRRYEFGIEECNRTIYAPTD